MSRIRKQQRDELVRPDPRKPAQTFELHVLTCASRPFDGIRRWPETGKVMVEARTAEAE
jgi:hypothetical protein